MSEIVLFGTGRGAKVAHKFICGDTEHKVVGFTVDERYIKQRELNGLPVVPFEEVQKLFPPERYRMIILLGYQGMNSLRQQKYDQAKKLGYILESYVASNIFRVEPISVGENCFIFDNQSISLDVKIGNNVVMWSSNHIGDLTEIEDHAWISSHVTVAANVTIGSGAFVGINATIVNGVKIGAQSFIGAASLITADTKPRGVYVQGQGELDMDSSSFMRVMISGKKL